jgi:2-oxoacid:acceptor oxidoreductase delta subunit (pyruvate/2-ketoisovalerate family)
VILAVGLQKLRPLGVAGEGLGGVEQGITFLHRVNLEEGAAATGHVVVLGGGNTAMDCARTALRLGAERVTVAYRRTRQEMPAIADEVEESLEEGVRLLLQVAPVAVHGDGRVQAIELAEVEMGAPDESGRRRPVVTERTSRLECSAVLLALGQSVDDRFAPLGWELGAGGRMSKDGAPINVFASGDVATWAGTVVHAIGHGHATATAALIALGEDVAPFARPSKARAVGVGDVRFSHFPHLEPNSELHRDALARLDSFLEVNEGLEDATEAHRCLSCGLCTHCDTCLVYCPEGGIHRTSDGEYAIDYDYCKGCGLCVTECPRGGLEMVMP